MAEKKTMTDGSGQPESIGKDESVIVVSDLHLGGKTDRGTSRRFLRFLDAVSRFSASPPYGDAQTINTGIIDKVLKHPQKIILLGDILELWNSNCDNRDYVTLDAIRPFAKLQEMDCDVVYVTGNHDESVGDLIDAANSVNCEKTRSDNDAHDFFTRDTKKFSLHKRHYIPGDNKIGLDVGGIHYAFLHGHQFDQEQLPLSISNCLKTRFDPIGYVAEISDNYVSKKISLLTALSILLIWVMLAWVYVIPENSFLVSILTVFLGGLIVASLVNTCILFGTACQNSISKVQVGPIKILQGVIAFVAAGLTALIVLGFIFTGIHRTLFLIIFALSTFMAALIGFPKTISFFQGLVYGILQIGTDLKGATVTDIVNRNFVGADFDPKKYSITADVVVFGHTHCADMPRVILELKDTAADYKGPLKVYFCNTGDWERVEGKTLEPPCPYKDTFIYIDHDGLFLLRWEDCGGGKIHHIQNISAASLMQKGNP